MAFKIIPESVKEYFSYDPESGVISRIKFRRRAKLGPVGFVDSTGYVRLNHERRLYYAHRIAWFLAHGEQPDVIDHINGDRTDNRLCNLRNVSHRENSLNRREPARGIAWQGTRWRAYIGGKAVYSGKSILLAHFHRYMYVTATYHLPLPPPTGECTARS